jgi:uncharacterized protein YjbI with pentapeptide repeats
MANREHLRLLGQGRDVWNRWRNENPSLEPDLRGAKLGMANLVDVYLSRTNLAGADLSQANLSGANLNQSDLKGASLSGANLNRALLSVADLTRADLSKAYLGEAYLNATNLSGADLSGADMRGARLTNADLSGANLSGVNLRGANLNLARLNGATIAGGNLREARLNKANLEGATITGSDLQRSTWVETNLKGATIVDCNIYGINVWNLTLDGAKQEDLIVTPDGESTVTVDDIEVAQFIYLLLNNQKIRNVINTITSKAVLILGRFTPERKRILDAMRERLRQLDYLPILFDFEKPDGRTVQETVTTLARMSRFVIADITDPKSIPQELISIVETMPSLPVQPLLQAGYEPWAMYDHICMKESVLVEHEYDDLKGLLARFEEKVVGPAETKVRELEAKHEAVNERLKKYSRAPTKGRRPARKG